MKITEEKKGMYILDDGRVRCYLFTGKNEAVLIDTGFPDANVIGEVKKITTLPLKVILTHGDMDHAGGVSQVGECFIHKDDFDLIPETVKKQELNEGETITCGDYTFKVVHIPGHTYGSVAFVEETKGFAITGDGVQRNGSIFMFGPARNFALYIESLKKLAALVKEKNITELYPGHSEYPLPQDSVEKVLEDAENLYAGKILPIKKHEFMPCSVYQGSYTGFLYQQE